LQEHGNDATVIENDVSPARLAQQGNAASNNDFINGLDGSARAPESKASITIPCLQQDDDDDDSRDEDLDDGNECCSFCSLLLESFLFFFVSFTGKVN
jgi:hypothetical protein